MNLALTEATGSAICRNRNLPIWVTEIQKYRDSAMGSGGNSDLQRFNDKGPDYSLNGKILVAAVIVLFVVFTFVVLLHLYARWFWRHSRRIASRRWGSSRRRRLSFAREEDPLRIRTVGLDPSVVEKLPTFVYKSENFNSGPMECAVCLCELEENEKARLLPKCNHSFHIECIDMWFRSHSTCPLCRASVQPDSAPPNEAESVPAQQIPGNDNSIAEETIRPSHAAGAASEGSPAEGGQTSSEPDWGSEKQIKNVEQAASSSRSLPQIVIDMPKSADSFSCQKEDQAFSPGGQSCKSPVTRLRSLKRMLSRGRDKRAPPLAPDEDVIEKDGQP